MGCSCALGKRHAWRFAAHMTLGACWDGSANPSSNRTRSQHRSRWSNEARDSRPRPVNILAQAQFRDANTLVWCGRCSCLAPDAHTGSRFGFAQQRGRVPPRAHKRSSGCITKTTQNTCEVVGDSGLGLPYAIRSAGCSERRIKAMRWPGRWHLATALSNRSVSWAADGSSGRWGQCHSHLLCP
jgi:hypothetical protein